MILANNNVEIDTEISSIARKHVTLSAKVNNACISILHSYIVFPGINNVKIDPEIFPIARIQTEIVKVVQNSA